MLYGEGTQEAMLKRRERRSAKNGWLPSNIAYNPTNPHVPGIVCRGSIPDEQFSSGAELRGQRVANSSLTGAKERSTSPTRRSGTP